jgi:signal transduction histidine kinase
VRDRLWSLERAAIAEEVASLVRHDVRNRLASVRNASHYLKVKVSRTELPKTDARVDRFFQLIEDELGGADKILGERLAMGRLFGQDVRELSPTACLDDALALAGVNADDVTVLRRFAETRPVTASADELTLALRLLVDNALESLAGPGTLTLRCEEREGRVVLGVDDSGPGFSPEGRELAFTAFASTKPGHAGIGLNIARRITERYRGKLTIAGESLVEVSLP